MDKYFKIIKEFLLCMLLVVLIALGYHVINVVDDVDKTVQNVPVVLQQELNDTRTLIHKELQQTRDFTGEQVSALTKTADNRLSSIQKDLNNQITNINVDLNHTLDKAVNDVNSQLTETNKNVAILTNAYADVPKTLATRLDPYTDCDHNALCWQGQLSDTLFAVRTTSRDVSKTMASIEKTSNLFNVEFPKISKDSEEIAANINKISDNIKRITTPHWYDKLIGYTLNAAILYRELNPVTQITSTVTSAISSQK